MAFLSAGIWISMTVLYVGTFLLLFEDGRTELNENFFSSARRRIRTIGQKLPAYK